FDCYFHFILLSNLFHPKHEAASDSRVMPGSVFDAVVTVFRLHKPDTKPFLDSEIYATATRDNKSGTWRVASSAPGERLHRHAVLSWKARGGCRRAAA